MKNGFTLIEMLVCIGIIATLGVVIGLNANKIIGNAQKNDNKELLQEVFDASMIYFELSTGNCGANATSCNITLQWLIEKGLIEDTFVEKYNPLFDNQKFLVTDYVKITKGSDKKKAATFYSGSCSLPEANIDNAGWGEC